MHDTSRALPTRQKPVVARYARWLAVLLVLYGVTNVSREYFTLSNTMDEPMHIGAGMEYLERGTFTFEPKHPPLARAAMAWPLYARGVRIGDASDRMTAGLRALYARDEYGTNLALARFGVLPFFLAACAAVWAWARCLYGEGTALVAVGLFVSLPLVIAHAGLATNDMAITAMVPIALLALTDRRTWVRVGVGGVFVALALLAKMSALVFLPACAVATWAVYGMRVGPLSARRAALEGCALAVVTFVVVWAGYNFSFGTPFPEFGDRFATPAPEFVKGAFQLAAHNRAGHDGYLLGETRRSGWWYFFPIAIAVKTPLPFLALVVVGAVALARERHQHWRRLVPFACAVVIILAALPSRINIGARHVLPAFPFLAAVAGAGAVALWRGGSWGRGLTVVMLAAQVWVVESLRPEARYLGYANILAKLANPPVLLDSDRDWGQDFLRLADTVKARRIRAIRVAYFGSLDVTRHGIPNITRLAPNDTVAGWVAISDMFRYHPAPQYRGYEWLRAYAPVARVGDSLTLYYVPRKAEENAHEAVPPAASR